MCNADIFLGIVALLFPPLAVWVKRGICSADSLINILLCVLGFIPGLLHSWYIIAKYPDPAFEYESVPQDAEGGRVTYVYVQSPPPQQQRPQPKNNQGGPNYGTAQQGGSSSNHTGQEQGVTGTDEAGGVPPSYADVVAGDNKVQSSD